MKKLNHFGFSLMELMITVAIVGGLSLVISDSFKQSHNLKYDLQRTGEVNNLIISVTTELGRKEVCEKNFKGLPITALASPTPMAAITYKSGTKMIEAGKPYGASIQNIVSISYGGAASTSTKTNLRKVILTVAYQVKQKVVSATIPQRQFEIPINMYVDAAGNIDTCHSDTKDLIAKAVEASCKGNTSQYWPPDVAMPYGHCEHEVIVLDSAGTQVPACPVGELLQMVTEPANAVPPPTGAKLTFKCSKLNTAGALPSCPAWSYMKGVGTDGSAICEDIRTIFPNTGVMTIQTGGTYVAMNIGCPTNQVLQRLDPATGSPICVNPSINYPCPPGQYVQDINALGQANCAYAADRNVCLAPNFISAIDSAGNVTCSPPAFTGSCPGDLVATGVDVYGNLICGLNQP